MLSLSPGSTPEANRKAIGVSTRFNRPVTKWVCRTVIIHGYLATASVDLNFVSTSPASSSGRLSHYSSVALARAYPDALLLPLHERWPSM